MRWIWREAKNRTNRRDHGLSFETARLAFDDTLAASRLDPHPETPAKVVKLRPRRKA